MKLHVKSKKFRPMVKNKKFECDECEKSYRTNIGLLVHLSQHGCEGDKLACIVCGKTCNSLGYLRLHIRHEHSFGTSPVSYECKDCGKIFKWPHSLKNHILIKHEDNPEKLYMCLYCDKPFLTQHLLKVHEEKHFSTRPYSCNKCGMKFKYENSRNKHANVVHSDKKDFQCSDCGKLFKTKAYLDQHISDVHNPGTAVQCSYCDKYFKTPRNLRSHVQICHTLKREKKYICATCHWKFYSPKDLHRHEKTHSKLKEHSCPVCRKMFTRKDNLQVHLNRHKTKLKVCPDIDDA